MDISGTYILHDVDGDISDIVSGLSQMGNPPEYTEADIKNMISSEIIIESESFESNSTGDKNAVLWKIVKNVLMGYNNSLTDMNINCTTEDEKTCVRSFIYNDEEHFGCIHRDRDQLWCATKGIKSHQTLFGYVKTLCGQLKSSFRCNFLASVHVY